MNTSCFMLLITDHQWLLLCRSNNKDGKVTKLENNLWCEDITQKIRQNHVPSALVVFPEHKQLRAFAPTWRRDLVSFWLNSHLFLELSTCDKDSQDAFKLDSKLGGGGVFILCINSL